MHVYADAEKNNQRKYREAEHLPDERQGAEFAPERMSRNEHLMVSIDSGSVKDDIYSYDIIPYIYQHSCGYPATRCRPPF
jgi:hypothetical protein